MKLNKGQKALSQTPQGREAVAKMLGVSPDDVEKYAAVGMKAMRPGDEKAYADMGMKAVKEYGIGGALMTLGSNLMEGKRFGSGALDNVGRNLLPGGNFRGGMDLAGTMMKKSKREGVRKAGEALQTGARTRFRDTGLGKKIFGRRRRREDGGRMYGEGGKYYENGGSQSEGGPFASAQVQIEQNLSPLRGDLLSQIESDPKKMAWAQENIPGGLENANIYQLSRAADPNHSDTQTNRLTRLARQANLPVATETANLYSRMNSGKFDVGVMDQAMLDRGYDGEAGDIFATGVVEGKIPLGSLISAETRDLGTIDDAGKFNFKVFDVPTGAEFLQTNKRRIKNDGSIKGDNTDDLTWYAQLGRGDRRDVSPEVETPETIIPEPPMQTPPGDPMATIPGRGPSKIPTNRPERGIQGGFRPLKDDTPEPSRGLEPSSIGRVPELDPSDYAGTTASQKSTGPFGTIQEDAGEMIDALQLAAEIQKLRSQRGMGGRAYESGGKMPKELIERFERMKMMGGRMYGMGGAVKTMKNYGHGGKNC